MKAIQLFRQPVAAHSIAHTIVDDEDYAYLMQWTWHLHKGEVLRKEGGGYIFLHFVVAARAGIPGAKHISHDKLDNRRSNFQPAHQNLIDHGDTWQSLISIDGIPIHLGFFPTVKEAETVWGNVKEKVLECIVEAARPPEPTLMAMATPLDPYWCSVQTGWAARIEINGIPVRVGYRPTRTEAQALTDRYFTKEKP